jgi:cell division protein FtsN
MTKKSLPKEPALQLSTRGVVGWVGLLFFISVWIFILGILVGRGMAPVQFDIKEIQKEIAALKNAQYERSVKEINKAANAISQQEGIDFHEALKKTEKKPEKIAKRDILPKIKKKSEKPKTYKRKEIILKREKQSATAGINKIETKKKYTVQVAASKDRKIANELVTKYIKKGYPAYTVVGKLAENNIWFRVRIGSYKDKADARKMLQKLKNEKCKPIIVEI